MNICLCYVVVKGYYGLINVQETKFTESYSKYQKKTNLKLNLTRYLIETFNLYINNSTRNIEQLSKVWVGSTLTHLFISLFHRLTQI